MPRPRIQGLSCHGWMPINASSDPAVHLPASLLTMQTDRTAQAIRAGKLRHERAISAVFNNLRDPLGHHRVRTDQRREKEQAGEPLGHAARVLTISVASLYIP